MLLDIKDKGYIWDIVDACKDITAFTGSLRYEEFCENKLVRFAVERQLLVIGEAVKKLSEEFKESHNAIPWKKIVGLRNILAHEYGELLTERIWLVTRESIPLLLKNLADIV